MEKQGVPMNQYPTTQDVNAQQQQPPVYQDPNNQQFFHQQQQQQGQTFQQQPPYQQTQYTGSPPPQQHQQQGYMSPQPTGGYQAPQQAQSPQPQAHPGMPPQAQSGTRYQSSTPIPSLGRGPAPVDCPACGQRAMTNVSYEVGNSTHAWALGLCCIACLGCIPYLMNSLKDVQHKCGKCGVLLATWHRSGSTEVHIHS